MPHAWQTLNPCVWRMARVLQGGVEVWWGAAAAAAGHGQQGCVQQLLLLAAHGGKDCGCLCKGVCFCCDFVTAD
jgi:hypothetical protein